jgi:hypothetical protein
MKKLFYILLILLLALLAAPYFIPLNTYKPFIASLVSKQTGLLLAIDGPIKLNLFPTIHVSIHDVHLKRPQGESMKELLTAKSLAVQMELWPLLRKEVNIKEILADHPILRIDANDVAFFKALSKTKTVATESVVEEVQEQKKQVVKAPLLHSTLQQDTLNIAIESGSLHYESTNLENTKLHIVLTKPFDGAVTAQGSGVVDKKQFAFDMTIGALASLQESNQLTELKAHIKYDNDAFSVKGKIKANDKTYTLAAFEATMDPWKVGGDCVINMAGAEPRYNCTIEQAITSQMLATMIPETAPKFLGTIFHKVQFTSAGTTKDRFIAQLSAKGTMDVKNAAIAGIQRVLPPSPVKGVIPDRLPIESLQGQYNVRSGVLHLTSSSLVSPVVNGNMQGSLRLDNLQLGMRASLQVLPLKKLDKTFANWNWQVDISGPLTSPRFSLNQQDTLLPNLLRKENADKLLEKVLPKQLKGLAPALSEGLMNLLK